MTKKNGGFTLVELLVTVALITITVGVTGDIVLSLIKSYNKTQITNEIEQNANFIMAKLEKELHNAINITSPVTPGGAVKIIKFTRDIAGTVVEITYEIKTISGIGTIVRKEGAGSKYALVNNDIINGVDLSYANSYFTLVRTDPDVVQVHMVFRQVGSPSQSFVGDVTLDSAIVLRGSY